MKKVRIRPEVACIINDGKSADMITLRVPSHHPLRRVSRCCYTSQQEADLTTKDCDYVQKNDEIEKLFRVVGMSELEVQEDPGSQTEPGSKPSREESESEVARAKKRLDELSFHPGQVATKETSGVRQAGPQTIPLPS